MKLLNPIILAGLHGILGGLVIAKGPQRRRSYATFGAPLVEEILFRGVPGAAGVPGALSSAAFAAAHASEDVDVIQIGDVLIGGILYQAAFKQFGIVGAIGAHVAHNLAVGLGLSLRGRKKR